MDTSKLDELTEEEQIVFKWQYGLFGDFFTALMDACEKADPDNLEKLSYAFPVHVSAFKKYKTVPLWWAGVREKAVNLGLLK